MIKTHLKFAAAILIFVTINSARAESIEQFNHDYYTKICEGYIACSDNVGIASNLQMARLTSVASCVNFFAKRDGPQKWQDTITQKTAAFQPEAGKACLSAIADLSCKELDRRLAKPSDIEGCEHVIVGTIDDFAQCDSHIQCKSVDVDCYGTCQPLQLEQCGGALCLDSEYCDTEKNACYARKTNGEVCKNSFECEDRCAAGICKAPRPVVKPGGQCGHEYSSVCSIGEFCADDSNRCTPYRKEGESCSDDYKQFKKCEALLDCKDDKCVSRN